MDARAAEIPASSVRSAKTCKGRGGTRWGGEYAHTCDGCRYVVRWVDEDLQEDATEEEGDEHELADDGEEVVLGADVRLDREVRDQEDQREEQAHLATSGRDRGRCGRTGTESCRDEKDAAATAATAVVPANGCCHFG